MGQHAGDTRARRQRRRWRIRKKIRGTAQRPRVCVYKSNANLHLQAIDDETGSVLAAASTLMPEFRGLGLTSSKSVEAARALAGVLAKRLAERQVEAVVFDRSGYPYHGRVKAIADELRDGKIRV
jgi:large subunit ribosomal protein L18